MSQFFYDQLQLRRNHQSKGFTVLELLVVLVIFGLFMSFGAKRLVSQNSKTKSSVRKFTVIAKKMRNKARVQNKTYRLVFDLPAQDNKEQSYWVESTDKAALLLDSEQREDLLEDLEEVEKETDSGTEKFKPDPQGFVPDTSVIRQAPAYLPDGLYFQSIEIDGDPIESLKTGRVYIYFFPNGMVQTSAIHITNRDNLNWTVSIQGVTGQVDIFPKFRSLEEIKDR